MASKKKSVKVKIKQIETDEQFMKQCFPDSCVNLKKWKSKYNFTGQLLEIEVQRLLTNLALHDQQKGRTRHNPGKQTLQARIWMEEIKRRKHSKTQVCAVVRKDDDDSTNSTLTHRNQPQASSSAQHDTAAPLEQEHTQSTLYPIAELAKLSVSPPPPPYQTQNESPKSTMDHN